MKETIQDKIRRIGKLYMQSDHEMKVLVGKVLAGDIVLIMRINTKK